MRLEDMNDDLNNVPVPCTLRVTATPVSIEQPDNAFLLFDSFESDPSASSRIIVFSSVDMRFKASLAKEIFADGTYRIVTKGFATLYTIHTVIDSIPYPIFFCLMENEREEAFSRVFSVIKPFLPKFNSEGIGHVDCQRASINALRATFGCQVKVCMFHVNQAVWRMVERCGLAVPYNNIQFPRLHAWLRRLMSFPFLCPENMCQCFHDAFEVMGTDDTLGVEAEFRETFKDVLSYYKRVWLLGVGPQMLSQFGMQNRTNNHAEAFHRWVGSSVQTAHPQTTVLIKLLSRVEQESRDQFIQQRLGQLKKRSEKRLDELETALTNAMDSYMKGLFTTDIEYLSVIAKVYVEYNHNIKVMRHRTSIRFVESFKRIKEAVIESLEKQNTVIIDDESQDEQHNNCFDEFVCQDFNTEIVFNEADEQAETTRLVEGASAEAGEVRCTLRSVKQDRASKKRVRKESTKPKNGGTQDKPVKRKKPTLLQRMKRQRSRSIKN